MSEGLIVILIVVAILYWIGTAILCSVVAEAKGERAGLWLALGLIFSWIALLAIAGMPDSSKQVMQTASTPNTPGPSPRVIPSKGIPQPSERLRRLRGESILNDYLRR